MDEPQTSAPENPSVSARFAAASAGELPSRAAARGRPSLLALLALAFAAVLSQAPPPAKKQKVQTGPVATQLIFSQSARQLRIEWLEHA